MAQIKVKHHRATREAGPPTCRCHPRPYVMATFREEQLVEVTRMHNRIGPNGTCRRPPEPLEPIGWLEGRL